MSHSETARQRWNLRHRRLPRPLVQLGRCTLAILAVAAMTATAGGQPPRGAHANIDYAASGFVAPAGMVAPDQYPSNPMMAGFPGSAGMQGGPGMQGPMGMPGMQGGPGMQGPMGMPGTQGGPGMQRPMGMPGMQAGMPLQGPMGPQGPMSSMQSPLGMPGPASGMYGDVAQGGISQKVHGCGSPSCDGNCGMGSAGFAGGFGGGGGGCDCQACGGYRIGSCLGEGGILGKLRSGHYDSCMFCIFCRGAGCGVCQSRFSCGALLGAFSALLPHQEAGVCAQRWYDLSAEAIFLGHDGGQAGDGALTRLGTGFAAPVVLSLDDAGSTDLEAGARLSAAMIFGPGGNLEFTYMGGQEWDEQASVSDPNANLYSFISDFGTLPPGGFGATDTSLLQSIDASSEFHSAELNYRRRTVGPYCRFQGSWLMGLRYLRYEDGFIYSTFGETNNQPRFFSSDDSTQNSLFGAQAGFDFWWNVVAGVNLGIGMKGGWLQNDVRRRTTMEANPLGVLPTPGSISVASSDDDATVMGEFETRLVYRLSHSWSLTTAYYLIGVEDIAFATVDGQTVREFFQPAPVAEPETNFDTLVLSGFSIGAEYVW